MKVSVSKSIFVLLFPAIYLLFPRPEINNIQFVIYSILGVLAVLVIISSISENINKKLLIIHMGFLFLLCILIIFSTLANLENINIGSVFHLFKPLFWLLILLFGYYISINTSKNKIYDYLLYSACFILVFQFVIAISQLVSPDFLNFIYSTEKVSGNSLRVVGTLNNPNLFAWFVIQCGIIILLLSRRLSTKVIFTSLVLILVILSGSRSALLLLPIIYGVSLLLNYKNKKISLIFYTPILIIGVYLSFQLLIKFLITYGGNLPYLIQILNIFETGNLSSINSFDLRLTIWTNAFSEWINSGIMGFSFGLGPGYFSFMDNDLLYSLFTYGFLFTFIYVVYLVFILMNSFFKRDKVNRLIFLYTLFAILFGLQSDTLIGWNYTPFLYFLIGISINICSNKDKE